MTIAALTDGRAQIAGDGTTGRVDLDFQFVDENDLLVIHTDENGNDTEWIYQQAPGSWYFTGGDYSTGTVFFTASDLNTGERLTVTLVSDYAQPFELAGGEIDPEVLERSMDRTALSVQAIAGRVNRSLSVSPSLEGELPDLQVPDLPDGYGFVRRGDRLVPALIDSTAISQAVSDAQDAQGEAAASALAAAGHSSDASYAKAAAETAQSVAAAAAVAASSHADDAEAAKVAAEIARDGVVADATEVLGSGRIPVGTMVPWFGLEAPNQYWLLVDTVGQVASRSLFPDLLNVLAPEYTVSFSSGDPVVTGVGSSKHIAPGMPIEGANIPAGTTILSVDGPSQITLSANPTDDGTALRIFPHGAGDGATTFGLPNVAGRVHRALDSTGAVNTDAGNYLGELQEDALQGHWHLLGRTGDPDYYSGEGSVANSAATGGLHETDDGTEPRATTQVTDGVNGTPRTAPETRAKAIIAPYVIKVADGVDDESTLHAIQVVQDLAVAQANIAALQTDLNAAEAKLVGFGQTWQNLTASRAINTVYQNTTSRPIWWKIITPNNATCVMRTSSDNVTTNQIMNAGGSNINIRVWYDLLIPPGDYYEVTGSAPLEWWELR